MEILEMAVEEQLVACSKEELLELASEMGMTAEMGDWRRPRILKEVRRNIEDNAKDEDEEQLDYLKKGNG